MVNKILYTENGVHQCWTCKNNVGNCDQLLDILDYRSIPTRITVILPQCKVADKYMFSVYQNPCSKYECAYNK